MHGAGGEGETLSASGDKADAGHPYGKAAWPLRQSCRSYNCPKYFLCNLKGEIWVSLVALSGK